MEKFNVYSLVFFVSGFILPILIMIIARFLNKSAEVDQLAGILGLICEIFAMIFGIVSWKHNLSKFIVITIIILIVGLVALLFMPMSRTSIEQPKAIEQAQPVTASPK